MSPPNSTPPTLLADYFDGQTARAQPVRLSVHGRVLHIDADPAQPDDASSGGGMYIGMVRNTTDHPQPLALRVPVRQVSWPERQRHGERQAYLPRHGLLRHADAAAWDDWAQASGVARSWLVPWMQSWRGALAAAVLLVAALWATWQWGVPAAGRGVVALLPAQADRQLGDAALAGLDRDWLKPSQVPTAEQQALRQRFEQAVARAASRPGALPPTAWALHFRRMPPPLPNKPGDANAPGIANAMALPGGHIIVTDGLVRLLADRPDLLVGVLGHELGHVQHRHGMRMLVQAGLLAAGSSLLIGDVSALLAAAPVLLGQAAYSREFEFEADAAAARLMRANGHDPADFSLLFDRLRRAGDEADPGHPPREQAEPDAPGWGIGMASHPPDAERVRRMVEQR